MIDGRDRRTGRGTHEWFVAGPLAPAVLGTSADPGRAIGGLLPWLAMLLGLVIIGGVVIALARRMTRRDEDRSPQGFTLHELRTLRDRGDLSHAEFERAKDAMIGRLTRETTEPGDREGGPDRADR